MTLWVRMRDYKSEFYSNLGTGMGATYQFSEPTMLTIRGFASFFSAFHCLTDLQLEPVFCNLSEYWRHYFVCGSGCKFDVSGGRMRGRSLHASVLFYSWPSSGCI